MNPATNVATGEEAPAREEELVWVSPARSWAAGVALFALPLAKWWRLTADADALVALTALVVAFGWWLSRAVQETPPRTSPGAAVTGIGMIALSLWLLTWAHVEDFWLLRWGWSVLAVALTLVLWGWAGPIRGLRPLLAIVAWGALPPGALPFFESPTWLCEVTASIAGYFLWQQDGGAVVQGVTIHLLTGSVLVGGGCTVLPLLVSLGHLFVPAWLIFQLSWRRALFIAATVTVVAFVLSIVRVAIMAVVVSNTERFDYWHGPNGASWFTAAGMLTMAWLIDRALRSRPVRSESVTLARGQTLTVGGLSVLSLCAAGGALWLLGERQPTQPEGAPVVERFRITQSVGRELPPWQLANARFPFVWERRTTYEAALAREKIEVRLCYAPCLLEGDPVRVAWAYGWLPQAEETQWAEVSAGGEIHVREHAVPGRTTWIVTLPVEAAPVANERDWRATATARLQRPVTWTRWIAGVAPLRDKRAHWLEVTWTGAGAPPVAEMRAVVAGWVVLARENHPR